MSNRMLAVLLAIAAFSVLQGVYDALSGPETACRHWEQCEDAPQPYWPH